MNRKLVIVSNRLPINIHQSVDKWQISAASGGLVSALEPLVKKNCGTWVGWPGCGPEAPLQSLLDNFSEEQGYQIKPVALKEDEVESYYGGFSNEVLWPLFHDLLGKCKFDLNNFLIYDSVNQTFAKAAAKSSSDDDIVWIHDYHLLLSGWYLRQKHPDRTIAFFLHIPFPAPDMFRRLPWSKQLIRGLLAYDLVGFQTLRDQRNFIHCVTSFIDNVDVVRHQRKYTVLRYQNRVVKVYYDPISIDFKHFSESADSPEVAQEARSLHESYDQRKLLLGIDRLDYTKGIPERFLAFERALEKYPAIRHNCSLLQVVVPSRTSVREYADLKFHLEQLAGNINGRFSEHGWVPLHYHYRSLNETELLAHYRASEIALVTPLRDGMNLVAKEFCACKKDNQGVLVLSEFAGAADGLGKHALLVNPYDLEETADMIYAAFSMTPEKRCERMSRLRDQVRRNDVQRWLNTFNNYLSLNSDKEESRAGQDLPVASLK
jgi:trehalose 6-phosphate synthase